MPSGRAARVGGLRHRPPDSRQRCYWPRETDASNDNRVTRKADEAKALPAEIVREFGPFAGTPNVRGVTYDGRSVWFAAGENLQSFEPASGKPGRTLTVQADAGTAFDGRHLYQLAG